eukprot:67040_1
MHIMDHGHHGVHHNMGGVHHNMHHNHNRQRYIPPAPMPHQMRFDPDGREFVGSFNHAFANAGKLSEAEFSAEIKQINAVFKSNASICPLICTGSITIIMFIAAAISIAVNYASFSMDFPIAFVFFPIGMFFCVVTAVIQTCCAKGPTCCQQASGAVQLKIREAWCEFPHRPAAWTSLDRNDRSAGARRAPTNGCTESIHASGSTEYAHATGSTEYVHQSAQNMP